MSPRRNWDYANPSLASECTPPPGGHTRLRVRGWGSPNSAHRRKSLALCVSVQAATKVDLFSFWNFK
jgi:hypothetical protein